MNLKEINIKNYRSIEEQTFLVEEKNKSFTYTLIGTNESGKTSFLKAISLIDEGEVSFPKDFFNDREPIEIKIKYELSDYDVRKYKQDLLTKGVDSVFLKEIKIIYVEVGVTFDPNSESVRKNFERCHFEKDIFPDYVLVGGLPERKNEEKITEDLSLQELFFIQLPEYFYKKSHFITFWKSDPKHLIGEQINLDNFSANPKDTSIPLFNCFKLAGFKEVSDIQFEIESIREDSSRRQNLQDKLGDVVTAHIAKIWPNHPIKVIFNINTMILEFLIEDDQVKYKTKTTSQRSDGFRQFISFLLTISAEHAANNLSRSILLIDEPETHLHPKAQEFLKEELIKITKANNRNNIVFFATHSSYMIDKDCMSRCYKVKKKDNHKTEVLKIDGDVKSYAEVNYDVFDIISSDYHNELYGVLQETNKKSSTEDFDKYLETKGILINKDYIYNKANGTTSTFKVTLPTYIRHQIHHPENANNARYTISDLEKSIKILLKLKK